THACVKQVGFQEYLPVGNGNHVGGDISRNIARLSFNDGQGGKRTATFYFALKRGRQVVHRLRDLVGLVDLGCTLQQTGVQVEHGSGIGFAAGWTAEQQGNFPVSHGLLGQVVVYDQCRPAGIPEIFANGGACKGCIELHRGRVGGRSRNHHRIRHGAFFLQRLNHLRYGGAFLTACNVDAVNRLAFIVKFFLIDNRIDRYRRFTGLPVTDDQLPLAATNGDHRVDCLDPGLQRFVYGLTVNHTRRFPFEWHFKHFPFNGAFSINGLTDGINHPSQKTFSHVNGGDPASPFDRVPFLYIFGTSQQYYPHVVFFEVQNNSLEAVVEFHQFAGLYLGKAVHASDPVTHLEYGPYFFQFCF